MRESLFCNLMISKEYVHLVLNNKEILSLMESFIREKSELFRYLLGYSWIQFFNEETLKIFSITDDDNIIFDSETASKLPVYPYYQNVNPYLSYVLVNEKHIVRYGGLYTYNHDKLINLGICNSKQFKRRFNVFCTSKSNSDLFKDINFEEYKLAVTGSVIPACNLVKHPLMNLFRVQSNFNFKDEVTDQVNEFDRLFSRYFNEYYCSIEMKKSDIDVMVRTQDNFEFIDIVRKLYNQLVVNICNIYSPYAEPEHVTIKPTKTLFLFVTDNFINENILNDIPQLTSYLESQPINISNFKDNPLIFIKKNLKEESIVSLFKSYIYNLYQKKIDSINKILDNYRSVIKENKDKSEEQILDMIKDTRNYILYRYIIKRMLEDNDFKINSETYPDYFQKENLVFQVNMKKNNYRDDYEYSESDDVSLLVSYKYFIDSPQLNRKLEIFPVKSFIRSVAKFHFGVVRGYWNGTTVKMLPSLISSHLTLNSHFDRRYYSSKTNEIKISLKYRQRGFGFLCNKKEDAMILDYISKDYYWNNLYNLNINDRMSKNSVRNCLEINHKVFRPRVFNIDFYPIAPPIDITEAYDDLFCQNKNFSKVDSINKFNSYINQRLGGIYNSNHNVKYFKNNLGRIIPLDINYITEILSDYN